MPPDKDAERQLLGIRLKEAREYLDLSQDEVARILGVPRSAISMMEAGQRRVDALELKKLADIYQRPVGYFAGESSSESEAVETVRHLARAASKLSDRDREELLRFAQFLQAKGPTRGS